MKRVLIHIAVIGILLTAYPSLASGSSCSKARLTDAAILKIVKAETARRGWVFEPRKWEIKINRKNCGYVFFASQVPAVPGGHFWIEISEEGKVVEYTPGA